MSCALTQGFSRDCKDHLAGITDIVLGAWSTVVASGLAYDSLTGEVEDLPSTITLYRYEVDDLSGNWEDAGTAEENGQFVFNPTITFRLRNIDTSMRKEFNLLIKNRLVAFIVPHRGSGFDKKLYAVGLDRGLQVTTGGFSHGAAPGDFTGLNVTLSGAQWSPGRLVEAYTAVPFDNTAFNNVTISPAFVAAAYL